MLRWGFVGNNQGYKVMTCLGLLWSSNAEREIPLVAHMKMRWLSRIDVWNGGGGGVVRHRR